MLVLRKSAAGRCKSHAGHDTNCSLAHLVRRNMLMPSSPAANKKSFTVNTAAAAAVTLVSWAPCAMPSVPGRLSERWLRK